MKRMLFAVAGAALLAGCEIPPYQLPVASDDAAGVAYWRCDQIAVAIVGGENDLFRQIFEREQLRRRCLAGETIATQEETPAAGPAAPESPRAPGPIPPPPPIPGR